MATPQEHVLTGRSVDQVTKEVDMVDAARWEV